MNFDKGSGRFYTQFHGFSLPHPLPHPLPNPLPHPLPNPLPPYYPHITVLLPQAVTLFLTRVVTIF